MLGLTQIDLGQSRGSATQLRRRGVRRVVIKWRELLMYVGLACYPAVPYGRSAWCHRAVDKYNDKATSKSNANIVRNRSNGVDPISSRLLTLLVV